MGDKVRAGRKPYAPPNLTKLNQDEARRLLEERVKRGDKEAKNWLDLLEESAGSQGKTERKKKAS